MGILETISHALSGDGRNDPREWTVKPEEARQQDPINPQRDQAGKAAVFIRRSGGHGVGHVGWGYLDDRDHVWKEEAQKTIAQDQWYIGAVDNPLKMPYAPAGQAGFWQVECTGDPLGAMRAKQFEAYKLVPVDQADTEKALEEANKIRGQSYLIFRRNCEDAVYQILKAYGTTLPDPKDIDDWEPNHWFDRIPGQAYTTDDDSGLYRDSLPG